MSNYGTFLAEVTKGILISYESYGSYSGDYVAIIEKGNEWFIYKGVYGSCGGCDWLEGAITYNDDDTIDPISSSEIEKYLKAYPPFLVIPKDQIPETIEDLRPLLPANTRVENDNYEDVELAPLLFNQIKNPQFDNLEYIEKKYEEKES